MPTKTCTTRTIALARAARLTLAAGLSVGVATSLTGCRAGSITNPVRTVFGSGGGSTFEPEDFIAPEGEPGVRRPAEQGTPLETDTTTDAGVTDAPSESIARATDPASSPATDPARGGSTFGPRSTANPGGGQLVTTPGRPVTQGEARPIGREALVNAKVGDLNGRPVFVDEFFEPIEDRLRAEAETMRPRQWQAFASEQITRRLHGMLQDELLRAEALASLDPEVRRQGVRNFLDVMRQNLVSKSRGSEQQLRRTLAEAEGKSLEDVLREQQESALVQLTIARDLRRRVNVSWRDIVQRYERDNQIYNPPPTAVFRLIRVRTDDEASMEAVRTMLNSGTPFDEVASGEHNDFNPEEGGEVAEAFVEGTYAETDFFGPDALNELAHTLAPGSHGGPVEFGSQSAWLRLDRVDRVSVPLYDAQLAIADELQQELLLEEQNRYVTRLIERARVTNIEETFERLMEVATERYGPSQG